MDIEKVSASTQPLHENTVTLNGNQVSSRQSAGEASIKSFRDEIDTK